MRSTTTKRKTTGDSGTKPELSEAFVEPVLTAMNDAELLLPDIVADPKGAIIGCKSLVNYIENEYESCESQEEFKAKFLESESASVLHPLHIRIAGLIANYITAGIKFPITRFGLLDTYNQRIFSPDKLVMKAVSPASKEAKPDSIEFPFEVRAHIIAMIARFKAKFAPPAGYLQFQTRLAVDGDVYDFGFVDATNMVQVTIVENGIHIGDLKNQRRTLEDQYAMASSRYKKSVNLLVAHNEEIKERQDVLQSMGRSMDPRALALADDALARKKESVSRNKKELQNVKDRLADVNEKLNTISTPVQYEVSIDEIKRGNWKCQLLNLSA